MVQEVVEIVVRERGSRATSTEIRQIGTASRTAAGSVRLLTSALAGLGAVGAAEALREYADEAIRVDNLIRTATSSQEEFAAVQAEVRSIANETRAPLEGTAQLYRRLRVATSELGVSQNRVLEVTKGLNAAIAISGVNASEAQGGLIQLAQGLASGRLQGDELRSVLENFPELARRIVANLPPALGATTQNLRDLAAEGRLTADVLFPALEAATAGFVNQLGEVQFTTGQTFNVLRNEVVAAVGDLNQLLGGSEVLNAAILDLAKGVRGNLVEGFAFFLDVSVEVLRTGGAIADLLNDLGIEVVPTLGQALTVVGKTALLFIQSIATGVRAIQNGVNAATAGIAVVGNALGLVSDEAVAASFADFNQSQDALITQAERTNATMKGLDQTFLDIASGGARTSSEGFNQLASSADALAQRVRSLREQGQAVAAAGLLDQAGAAAPVAASAAAQKEAERAAKAQAAALERVRDLTDRIRIDTIERTEPLDAQLEKLRQQRVELEKQAEAAGNRAAAEEGLRLLSDQIVAIEDQKASLASEQTFLLSRLEELMGQIARTAPEFADELERAANAAIETGGGLEDVNGKLRQLVERGTDTLQREQERVGKIGEEIGQTLAGGISGALRSSLEGEAVNFGETLANVSADLFQISLDEVLRGLGQDLQGLLKSTGLGGEFGASLGTALGFGAGILASALRGSSAEVSNDFVQSAVTEARDVRGVVAGPTSIPIFQLGEELEDALDETNGILREMLATMRRQGAVVAASGPTGSSGILSELGTTSPSLA